jgi:hypothetical protein
MSPPRPRHLLLRPLLLLLLLLPVALALAAPKYDGVLRPQPDGSVVSYMVPHATPLHAARHSARHGPHGPPFPASFRCRRTPAITPPPSKSCPMAHWPQPGSAALQKVGICDLLPLPFSIPCDLP